MAPESLGITEDDLGCVRVEQANHPLDPTPIEAQSRVAVGDGNFSHWDDGLRLTNG